MKKRKSVAFRFALGFSIVLTLFSIVISLLISEFLWLSIRNQKASELESAAIIIEKAIEKQDEQQLNNGFTSLPYYIDYLVYSTTRYTASDDYEIICSNNPYLPHLRETIGKAQIYYEENYYIDGNLNILYYAKRLKHAESVIMIQTSVNMDSDSSTKFFNVLPKIIGFALIPIFVLCFMISMYFTKRTLTPIVIMTEKAKKIGSSNLDDKLYISNNGNEFDELANTFNELFNRLKNDFDRERQFTSDVSHELRTPVAVISGQSNLLRRWGKDDPVQLEKSLGIIINETKSMENIISILLQMSRLECGKIQPDYTKVNLKNFFERLREETQTISQVSKVLYNEKINVTFTTDEELLHQVFMVVISNSLKFCPSPLEVTLTYKKSGGKHIFEIADNGPGFSENIVDHVFERFYRGDDAHSRAAGGSGLGLSIAKTIINSMNGIIEADNVKKGHGAVIRIIF